jgi:polyphosphate glucokinase
MLGEAARKRVGEARWNRRVARAVRTLDSLLRFDRLYIGGGNSRRVTVALGPNVELVDTSPAASAVSGCGTPT